MKTPTTLLCTLLLLAGSLGAPAPVDASPDLDALRLALGGPGFVGLAPDPAGAPVLHVAYAPGAAVPAVPASLVPAGWDLVVHRNAEVGTLALPVDREDLARPTADGTPPVPADARGIGPGSPLLIDRPDGLFICTANYIFESGGTHYLGAAGHCFLPSGAAATHSAGASVVPNPTASVTVEVCVDFCYFGGQLTGLFADMRTLGDVAYARQEHAVSGEQIGWDFGVVEIPVSLEPLIRRSMPVFHGPTGQDGTETPGGYVAHYGNGIDFGTSHVTKGRAGIALNDGIPESIQMSVFINGGDSGSPINKAVVTTAADVYEGRDALGVITHGVITGGVPLGWGTSIDQAIDMADDDAGLALTLELPPRWG